MDDRLAHREGTGRLAGRVAIVVGAGQSEGSGSGDTTVGNGRATAIVFAREGASVLVVDQDLHRAHETTELITEAGGAAAPLEVDITDEDQVAAMPARCVELFGPPTILHNNVGVGTGDGGVTNLDREIWDRIFEVNVLAMANARHGIRVNAIMPGLMDTPMAIGGHSRARGIDPDQLRANRDERVPLGRRQGTGWDTAYAALYLVSEDARFVTGAVLPVDGGQSARIG